MDRIVRVYDRKRKMPLAIRLGDVPNLFSEGLEPEAADQQSPSLEAVKSRVGQILRQVQMPRVFTTPVANSQ
ncbi:MAG: hypothetical protein WDN29_09565 [Methylovirgula sp.]